MHIVAQEVAHDIAELPGHTLIIALAKENIGKS